MRNNNLSTLLNIIALISFGVIGIVFSLLFFSSFNSGFIFENKVFITIASIVIILVILSLGLIFMFKPNDVVYKTSMLVLGVVAVAVIFLYVLKISGVFDKIQSVEELRQYVASFGGLATFIYIVMNVLQVVVLPIPGFVAIATGVALFGPLKATIYSFIGILIGSLLGFFIGKYLGYKVVKWLVGKETLDKWLNAVKNKDRIVLTFMFLFPLFPDDVLCFVAGLSSMSTPYFIIMIIICRLISCVVTSYSLNGNLIPYNTTWGIIVWAIIIAVTVAVTILLYKHGDKIEKKVTSYLRKKFKGDKNGKNNSSRWPK